MGARFFATFFGFAGLLVATALDDAAVFTGMLRFEELCVTGT
jgi:hypothetical protein